MPSTEAPIGIAGTGRMAQALGRLLAERGEKVAAVGGRDEGRAAEAASFIGHGVQAVEIERLPGLARRILIAVSDEAIGEVSGRLAGAGMRGGIALHTCGARGPEALGVLADRGVACGVLHPLQTVASPSQGVAALPGSGFLVDGEGEARGWAVEIVALLNGRTIEIPADQRALYHAAAVLASNCLVALMSASAMVLARAGMSREQALQVLAPLARTSLENAISMGPALALTGPVRRGDLRTVQAHLDALQVLPPDAGDVYRVLGLEALALAESQGLAPETVRCLETLLRRGSLPSDD